MSACAMSIFTPVITAAALKANGVVAISHFHPPMRLSYDLLGWRWRHEVYISILMFAFQLSPDHRKVVRTAATEDRRRPPDARPPQPHHLHCREVLRAAGFGGLEDLRQNDALMKSFVIFSEFSNKGTFPNRRF